MPLVEGNGIQFQNRHRAGFIPFDSNVWGCKKNENQPVVCHRNSGNKIKKVEHTMRRRRRAYAYIVNKWRLLLFTHTDFPEAGVQVPAGTVQPSESPAEAVMREAEEETGLANLEIIGFLGQLQSVQTRDNGEKELQDAYFYHLRCLGNPPATWRNNETSGGTHEPIRFDFFWATLPDRIPELIGLNGAMLTGLTMVMKDE